MRAAVSKASPEQSPAVDDTDAQACVTGADAQQASSR